MEKIQDKIFLLAVSLLLSVQGGSSSTKVLAFFLCVTLTCVYEYMSDKRTVYPGFAVYLILMVGVPEFLLFFPVVLYDVISERNWWLLSCYGVAAVLSLSRFSGVWGMAGIVGGTALAVYMAWRTGRFVKLQEMFRDQRDNSRELELMLREKNRNLLEKQDYEVRLATLNERNRIAREIHDNVGHMLSRSILQTAALRTIAGEETVKEQLELLSATLNQAMDNIRESVHDLHDDSLNLESAVEKILDAYKGYEKHYTYDIRTEMDRETKICFLSVVKEGFSNVVKHSDATAVRVAIQEFQQYYQMLFQDNGSAAKEAGDGRGMGLENMRVRVEALRGTMNVRSEQGFRIFISIPKE